jgi:hypothetical protein
MPNLDRPLRSGLAAALCALLGFGCAYADRGSDRDRTPVRDTGVGASIIYPGQSVTMPGTPATPAAPAQPGATPDPQGAAQGSVAPGSSPVTFIGGASQDDKRSVRIEESPLYYKYLLLPFAIAAAPFVAVADALRPEEEPGPPVPGPDHARPAPPPPPPPVDYETARLAAMEREIEDRQPTAQAPTGASAAAGSRSISDELAALQRTPVQAVPEAPARPRAAAPPAPADPVFASADGIVDRDDDGRIDQWIFREDGEIVRNVFDDDGDGRPDRTLHYDRSSHRIAQVEEDTDRDGAVDSWTDYRDGVIVRRRADADRDGNVDSWSYFRGDELARHESDTTGDGFRDRVRFYASGALSREEQDNDGDGNAEVTLYYDADARITRRDEDTDGDGRVDVISHYEDGHLTRRELLGASTAPEAP